MDQKKTVRQVPPKLLHMQRIKRLVRGYLGEGVKCMVHVQETICLNPDCAGPATEIRIVMFDMQQTKVLIHKALSEVSAADVAAAI